ncbi:hypothetical protein C4572_01635 [Candidatus Parcubacteria bacterium]|nr:MAG: hypothetical protein C4572_01635 [Candidatus Parcubacteria bacterium]
MSLTEKQEKFIKSKTHSFNERFNNFLCELKTDAKKIFSHFSEMESMAVAIVEILKYSEELIRSTREKEKEYIEIVPHLVSNDFRIYTRKLEEKTDPQLREVLKLEEKNICRCGEGCNDNKPQAFTQRHSTNENIGH